MPKQPKEGVGRAALGAGEDDSSAPLLENIRKLISAYHCDEAEELLEAALKQDPKNSDLWAELGIVYALTQREVRAAELLQKAWGGQSERKLAQTLVDHFECRKRMARLLGKQDDLGAGLNKHVRNLTGLEPQDAGIKLSACLIVKNEESHLDRCLKSLKTLVDEIVVVDTGSTDGTISIAERYGAVIGHFDWIDDFSAARNESLRLATGDWILWIDADEELQRQSLTAIREGLMRPQFGGYFVKIVNFMDEEGEANRYVHSPMRLFRRLPGVEFTGIIHEQVSPSLVRLGLPNATLENALIHHYGYRPSEMEAKGKIRRTLDLLERQVKEQPGEAFHWFNLANAQSVAENYPAAADAAVECIDRLDESSAFGSLTYQILQTALIELGRPEEALDRADEAANKGFAGILTEFERAHALSRLGRHEAALKAIDKCFALEWPRDLTGDYGIVTHKRHLLKGQILAQMGRQDEALELLAHVLDVDPSNAAAIHTKGAVLEKKGQFEEALKLYERVFASKDQGWAARKGAARIHLVTGAPSESARLAQECWRERPEDMDSWSLWLAACESQNDFEGGCGAFEALLTSREPTADTLINYGRLLESGGEPKSALNCYIEAAKLDPEDANAYFNCGDVLYKAAQYKDAAAAYEAGLRIEPHFAQGWFVLGNAFAQLGSVEGATLAYAKALELEPEHAGADHNLSAIRQEASAA